MTAGPLLLPAVITELHGTPFLHALGLDPATAGNMEGNMEGKEVRFGVFHTAFYNSCNMAIPAGTQVRGARDSFAPLTGVPFMLLVQVDAFFGGLGTGFLHFLVYLVIAAFGQRREHSTHW